ncbi:PAQR family membrane homeostasis protein TrhA [Paenibacillus glycanilyticus]|uniref:Hemolysin III family protein n=1 Tax=Paenibacillus glycanilyticus TaxID=126569 RepID=A0ABQ6GFG3_9BACL|nr:hemolysin III family protein [Paenibacillus glycanilyticus]GLX69417.1 hemolysin III family protein [Paenibacillus glycanilyticus]
MASTHVYSKKEEVANALTHGIGAGLSIAALVLLIVRASYIGEAWHIVSFTLFGLSMVILYLSSTLLHSFPEGKVKDLFEIFDHGSIYLFIAGTYTPYLLVSIRSPLGWSLFGIVWGLAVFGVVFKWFFVKKFLVLSTLGYVVMGWMIVFAWGALVDHLAHGGLVFLVIGGVCYTVGSIFYVWRGFTYHHAVWHLFVIAGSICHFFSVLLYV